MSFSLNIDDCDYYLIIGDHSSYFWEVSTDGVNFKYTNASLLKIGMEENKILSEIGKDNRGMKELFVIIISNEIINTSIEILFLRRLMDKNTILIDENWNSI